MNAGDRLPPLERTIDLPRMVAYAGATWDWHRLHYDRRVADPPVVDGQLLGALMAEQLLDALGPRAFIRELAFRFTAPVVAGDTVRCEADVTVADDAAIQTSHRVTVSGRVVAEGTAVVAMRSAAPGS